MTNLFTLRGHNRGVTALAECSTRENRYLISGDEEGSLLVWDLTTWKKIGGHERLTKSRVQSLRTVKLEVDSAPCDILIAQSRDHGVQVYNLAKILACKSAEPIATHQTMESLFSRGDAISISDTAAILAYPSCIENHLVTIRIVGPNAVTQISGSAQRYKLEAQRTSSIFDIAIKEDPIGGYILCVAYEDGCLCIFTFCPSSLRTDKALNSTGLKVDLVRTYQLGVNDFMSAFDVSVRANMGSRDLRAVCGSPLNRLYFISDSMSSSDGEPDKVSQVDLNRPGTSAASIRPDGRLVATAGWDKTVRLHSMKSHKLLATLRHHLDQVQDIIFIQKPPELEDSTAAADQPNNPNSLGRYLLCCASMDCTVSFTEIY